MKKLFIASNKICKKKLADSSNAKEYDNSYLKRKNTKWVKQSKIITHQLKAIENRKIIDIKWVIIEYPRISHKLSKAIKQAEQVSLA